jgi:mono/diheme cytochrome c family protein
LVLRGAAAALAAVALMGAAPAAALEAATLYRLHCSGCHQADGTGIPDKGVPSVRGTLGYFLHSDAGRAFLVQVPGTSQAPITDAQAADLLNWMLDTFSAAQVPPQAPRYTAAEVARHRAHRLDDVVATRRAIVQTLRQRGLPVL